ncbi:hypothetical protein D6D13_07812 [Aureobasidium pullulans]|uniref:Uncharacterized protein n=1 Tax=Aureobasidium pullulans TaxID=5580 RepID=A0A4S9C999_AURPU|nr:hypothetical protein D6D13_07812 [Aureobasidium pullulans]
MANSTDTRVNEAQAHDTWFPGMDPIDIAELCRIRPRNWLAFHDEAQHHHNPPSQQISTPVLTENPPSFSTKRIRDSICVYKDRKSKPRRQVRRKPNELSEPTVTDDEVSERQSTSLKSDSIRSQASILSRLVVKKAAKSFCVFMLCTPPDDYTAPPSRAVSLPANASTTSKIANKFWTFVDGESRYPPQAKSGSRANLTSSTLRPRDGAAAINHGSTTTISHVEGPDPNNTPRRMEAREAFPIFDTDIWKSARRPSSLLSMHSQASQKTYTSTRPLPPTPYLTPHSPDEEYVSYNHREWIPEQDISPCTSIHGDGTSNCQTDVRRASDMHSQHCGWDLGGSSVTSAESVYSKVNMSREQSFADDI